LKTSRQEQAPRDITGIMLEAAWQVAEKSNARSIFANVEALVDRKLPERLQKKIQLVSVVKDEQLYAAAKKITRKVLQVPNVKLGRVGQVKLVVLMGLSANLVQKEDTIVYLPQNPNDGSLDGIMVIDVAKEFDLITSPEVIDIGKSVRRDVFEAVVSLALELAHEGREGKPVGAIFVVGDHEKVLEISRQITLNPFRGYEESERNILDPTLRDTIKEFAALDGAFVITADGTVVTSGRHLSAALEGEDFPQGLGSRHVAAAGISDVTNAIAITISESTGTVRVFRGGKILVELEKAAPIGRPSKQWQA